LVEASRSPQFERVLGWADQIRRLGVRANADTPADALKALEHGAEGIGLCRTEHMFMAADRQPKMRAMVMARTEPERRAALADLLPLQQADFEGLFAVMTGRPITIRLLDPPLHEFLPDRVLLAQRVQKARDEQAPELPALEQELELVQRLGEVNPMLGTRGCRLGLVHPEIYEMQVEAIMRAARAAAEPPKLEIMIPLVDFSGELVELRALVERVGESHGMRAGEDYLVGTMIELPRACFIAGRLAGAADFFSFGTNDLTQTALGFSRDDVEGGFVSAYLERRIIDRSPFESIDRDGVGALVELAVERGRARREGIELGVCGEHGGDPDSIDFFHRAGLDYVSCSPFRLPIARVAAAQAALRGAG
jgi:pyruvate,orthophosphate dikinase